MPEDELLKELLKYLEDPLNKKYVEAYIRDKEHGLSSKFDEIVKATIDET